MNIDVISQICVYNDYPIYRHLIGKYRDNFKKIILYPSRHHGVIDMEEFLKRTLPETWVTGHTIDWTTPEIDWRQAETEPCLELSDAEWVLFLEQDFFVDDWNKLWRDVEFAMQDADLIGWWNETEFPYIHPCFLLIKRELLEKTNKDFRAHPEIPGADHFAQITRDVEKLGGTIIKLQDLGWTDPENAFHLGGLTYPYQDFKGDETIIGVKYPEAFATYNYAISHMDLDAKYKQLVVDVAQVLKNKSIKSNPKWEKFFKL